MDLKKIRDKARKYAVSRTPDPIFGVRLHEHGETEQRVMMSIDKRFRDNLFIRSMQLLNDEREPYECESPGIYFCEIFNALKDAGASVFIVCHDPWHANISFKKSSCELTFCDVVKMEIEMFGGVTMHASPDDIVQLILLLQKIRVPHDKLLKESLKQYNCQKIMEVTAMHLKADQSSKASCKPAH